MVILHMQMPTPSAVSAVRAWCTERVRHDAHAWGIGSRSAFIIAIIPILIACAMLIISRFFWVFRWVSEENSLLEWTQFLLLIPACLLLAWLGSRALRQRRYGIGLLYALLAIGVLFVAGEEIAWGQDIVGWGTPAALDEVNSQHETTLHNIGSAHNLFINAVMVGGLYGTIVPLLWVLVDRPRRSTLSYIVVPPLCLIPSFVIPFGYRLIRLLFSPELRYPDGAYLITKYSETTELCLYFGILAFAILHVRLTRHAAAPRASLAEATRPSMSAAATAMPRSAEDGETT